jgi:hypothetical protein
MAAGRFQSRKRFHALLWQALSLFALLGASIGLSRAQNPAAPAPRFQYANAIDDPMGQQRSLVLDIYGDFAIRGRKLHPPSLQAMLTTGIKLLSGENDPNRAWRTVRRTDDEGARPRWIRAASGNELRQG